STRGLFEPKSPAETFDGAKGIVKVTVHPFAIITERRRAAGACQAGVGFQPTDLFERDGAASRTADRPIVLISQHAASLTHAIYQKCQPGSPARKAGIAVPIRKRSMPMADPTSVPLMRIY